MNAYDKRSVWSRLAFSDVSHRRVGTMATAASMAHWLHDNSQVLDGLFIVCWLLYAPPQYTCYKCDCAAVERLTGRYTNVCTQTIWATTFARAHFVLTLQYTVLVRAGLGVTRDAQTQPSILTCAIMFYLRVCCEFDGRTTALSSSFLLRFFVFNGLIVFNVFVVRKA